MKSLLERPLGDVIFSLLDTETTGLSPRRGGRVCEVAVLKVRGGKRVEMFQSLVNPLCSIDPGAQAVHGITSGMVADAPTFPALAPRLIQLLRGTVMVCHNAPFDVSFMTLEFKRAGGRMPEIPVVDTLSLARRHFKFKRNGLGYIAGELGVETGGWHRAGNDVAILDGVFRYFLQELAGKGTTTLEALLKL